MPLIAPPKQPTSKDRIIESGIVLGAIGIAAMIFAPALTVSVLPELMAVGGGLAALQGLIYLDGKKKLTPAEKIQQVFAYTALWYSPDGDKAKYPKMLKEIEFSDGRRRFLYAIPTGYKLRDFMERQEALEAALGGAVDISQKKGVVVMDYSPGYLPDLVHFRLERPPAGMFLPAPVGYGRQGLVWMDLADAPHVLTAGLTNMGKSNFLRQLIVSLLVYKPDDHYLAIFDFADGSQFTGFEKYTYLKYELKDLEIFLDKLRPEMKRRLGLLRKAGVEKKELYKGDDMPYVTIVIDEFLELMPDKIDTDAQRKCKQKLLDSIMRIAAQGRKVGFHLVAGIQRPDKDQFPGRIKQSFPHKVCFAMSNEVNSRIVLGEGDDSAAYLQEKGRCIYQIISSDQELQTMLLPSGEARKLIPESWRFKTVPPFINEDFINVKVEDLDSTGMYE